MKNKYVAAALAFFLGGIGVHKFYLGKNGQGILYLVFFWTYIPAIIAFVECIMFLVMDQKEFDKQYNKQADNYVPTDTYYEKVEVVSSKPQSIPEYTQGDPHTYKRKNRFLPDDKQEQPNANSDKKICPKCGAENDNENNFCEFCGTKLS